MVSGEPGFIGAAIFLQSTLRRHDIVRITLEELTSATCIRVVKLFWTCLSTTRIHLTTYLSLGYIVVCLPETTVPGRVAKGSVSVTSCTKDLGEGDAWLDDDNGIRKLEDGRVSYNDSLFRTTYFKRR